MAAEQNDTQQVLEGPRKHQKRASRQSIVLILANESLSLANNDDLEALANSGFQCGCICDSDADPSSDGVKSICEEPISRLSWPWKQAVQLKVPEQDEQRKGYYNIGVRLDRVSSRMWLKRFLHIVDSVKVYNAPISVG